MLSAERTDEDLDVAIGGSAAAFSDISGGFSKFSPFHNQFFIATQYLGFAQF